MELIEDKRTDPATRVIFVRAFELVEHCIAPDGTWLSMAHEFQAVQALQREFADLVGQRLFAVMAYACSVRASGRLPV